MQNRKKVKIIKIQEDNRRYKWKVIDFCMQTLVRNLNGVILGAMETFLQRFGLGFLINSVLSGILNFFDRIR